MFFGRQRARARSYGNWRRREWVANSADPTQVIEWRYKRRFIEIVMLASWDVEFIVYAFGRKFRTYGAKLAVKFFSRLEDKHTETVNAEEDDPMGSIGRYE